MRIVRVVRILSGSPWQPGDTPNNEPVQLTSDIEQSNDLGKYGHLIETEFLQSLGKTAYHCKEHYHIWDTDSEWPRNKSFLNPSIVRYV